MLDGAAALLIAVGAGYLAILRPDLPGQQDLIPRHPFVAVIFAGLGGASLLALWRLNRTDSARPSGLALRVAVYAVGVVLVGMAASRQLIARHESSGRDLWPPRVGIARAVHVDSLTPVERAKWGLWVGLHLAAGDTVPSTIPMIPAEWPFPSDVELAVDTVNSSHLALVATAGVAHCRAVVVAGASIDDASGLIPKCDSMAGPLALALRKPNAAPDPLTVEPTGSSLGSWPQYRGDASRTATAPGAADPAPRGWRSDARTPVRATVSVAAERVFVGGHATGMLVALGLADGRPAWTARAPNWIHQDAIIHDGRVFVGFGDKTGSFVGRAPSGIAAFDETTGARLWTSFDESSVMTAPVASDSVVVYATSAGVLRERHARSGELLASSDLPGGVIMAPPVLMDSAVLVTLDVNLVCAVAILELRTIWCQRLRGLLEMGHASAAVADGVVIVSGIATAASISLADWLQAPLMLELQLLRAMLFPVYWDVNHPGQQFLGLDLRDGTVLWRSSLYHVNAEFKGHHAGTAAVQDGVGVISLPIAGTLVAFEVMSGRELWRRDGEAQRGPPLLIGNRVIFARGDGLAEILDLTSGKAICDVRRDVGWDRAGPVRAGNQVILADVDGLVEAIPVDDLLACRTTPQE